MSKTRITSAAQALRESVELKSIWSKESHLSQRILIYCASLLEQIAHKPKRPLSAWQRFLSAELKNGATVKQAAERWRQRKLKRVG